MIIQQLPIDPQWYLFVVVTIVISIVLHELAHGYAALRLGDPTPLDSGHMTGNPLVHMGPFSLVATFLIGIAWGQMPIDPSRLRGRWAEAIVAAAGPATNLVLGMAALTALGLWLRLASASESLVAENAHSFLTVFGTYNLMLCLFNLFPVPPLDGSHILANCYRPYALAIGDPSKQGIWLFAFFGVFILCGPVFVWIHQTAGAYIWMLAG